MSLKTRLQDALTHAQMKPTTLAGRVGVSRATVSLWLSGGTQSIEGENLTRAAIALGVNPHWLSSGEGPPRASVNESKATYDAQSVPLYAWDWLAVDAEGSPDADVIEFILCPVPHGSDTFAVKVRGDAMAPIVMDGDLVFIDPTARPDNRSIVLLSPNGQQHARLRQLLIQDGTRFVKPANPSWPEGITPVPPDTTVLGAAIYVGRPLTS